LKIIEGILFLVDLRRSLKGGKNGVIVTIKSSLSEKRLLQRIIGFNPKSHLDQLHWVELLGSFPERRIQRIHKSVADLPFTNLCPIKLIIPANTLRTNIWKTIVVADLNKLFSHSGGLGTRNHCS
jgi:hypothetical protein